MTTDTKNENTNTQVPQEVVDEMRSYAESRGFTSEKVGEIVQRTLGSLEKALGEREIRDPKAYGVTIVRNSLAREFSVPDKTRKQERTHDQGDSRSKETTKESSVETQPTAEIKRREALEIGR